MKNKILILTCLILTFSVSCTDDFNEINEQPDALSVTDVSAKFFVTTLQQKLFRANVFEIWYGRILHPDMFAGHISGGHSAYAWAGDFGWNYWNALTDNGSWGPYASYNSTLTSYMNLVGEGGVLENEQYYALGLVMKSLYYHTFTDMFGAIPYSEASNPDISLPIYDNQIDIYKGIIADLNQAISIIGSNNSTGEGVDKLTENDVVFNGNMQNWKKLANSLKLRIALRAHGSPGENFSATTASEAIASGVLADEDALFEGYAAETDIWGGSTSYGDVWHTWPTARWKIAEPMINILSNNNDPRLAKIAKASAGGSVTIAKSPREGENVELVAKHVEFLKGTFDKAGLVLDTDYTWNETGDDLTITMPANTNFIGVPSRMNGKLQRYFNADLFSDPSDVLTQKVNEGKPVLPTVIITAADTHFMIAEAIVKGLASVGDASSYYHSGLTHAMNYWGTAVSGDFSASDMGTLSGSMDEKLEKIATQRWIANYTNSYEAWSIVRDTGYPKTAFIESTNDEIISLAGPLNGSYANRLRYGTGVYLSNGANVEAALAQQGPDLMSTKLWFAK